MKNILLAFFVLLTLNLIGQTAKVVKVKKIQWQVDFIHVDSIFWIGKENFIKINVKGSDNYTVNMEGGKIAKIKDGYQVFVSLPGGAIITVFECLPNNKKNILKTQLFNVKYLPQPVFYIGNVKQDSLIDKLQIIKEDKVSVYHPFYKMYLPVVNFDMISIVNQKVDTLSSYSYQFSVEMKKRLYYLSSGSILYFENVYFKLPDGTISKPHSFQMYVANTSKYLIGTIPEKF